MTVTRRTFLSRALAGAGLVTLRPALATSPPGLPVPNITGLYAVEVARIASPVSTAEVAQEVRRWPGRIAVGGGRYSMGGQTAISLGLHLDMRRKNRLLRVDPSKRIARVQEARSAQSPIRKPSIDSTSIRGAASSQPFMVSAARPCARTPSAPNPAT